MKRFPDDHPVEIARGLIRPSRAEALTAIAHRVAWLQERIATKIKQGRSNAATLHGYEMAELKGLVTAAEVLEAFVAPDEDVADVLAEAAAPVASLDEVRT